MVEYLTENQRKAGSIPPTGILYSKTLRLVGEDVALSRQRHGFKSHRVYVTFVRVVVQ